MEFSSIAESCSRIAKENLTTFSALSIFLLLIFRVLIGTQIQRVLSSVIHFTLSSIHTVKHTEDHSSLPSARYCFPNGQGDVAKFLHGKENSIAWESQFGPIYRIWSGTSPEVVLTKPEHIQQVFKDSDKHIKAVNNNSGFLLGQLLGKCVGLISRDEWKTVRSISEPPFLRPMVPRYTDIVKDRTHAHFRGLERGSNLPAGVIDPAQDLKMLPFWIIADVIYGSLSQDMEKSLSEIALIREDLFRKVIAGGVSRFEWSRHLPTKANEQLNGFKGRWEEFNIRARNRALEMKIKPPIIDLYDAISAGSMTLDHVLHTLDEVLFANLDVTLGGISWNLVFLAAYPHCQARVLQEVSECRKSPKEMDKYFLDTTTYLSACILESSRLRPLAAFSVPQAIPTERIVGGYHFPKGTNFIVDAYALNQRNDFWGKNSLAFEPERHFSLSATKSRYNFWRFGFGPRQCMGKYVADMMMRVLLVYLVENYQLGLTAEQTNEWERDAESWINHPDMKLKCTKKQ